MGGLLTTSKSTNASRSPSHQTYPSKNKGYQHDVEATKSALKFWNGHVLSKDYVHQEISSLATENNNSTTSCMSWPRQVDDHKASSIGDKMDRDYRLSSNNGWTRHRNSDLNHHGRSSKNNLMDIPNFEFTNHLKLDSSPNFSSEDEWFINYGLSSKTDLNHLHEYSSEDECFSNYGLKPKTNLNNLHGYSSEDECFSTYGLSPKADLNTLHEYSSEDKWIPLRRSSHMLNLNHHHYGFNLWNLDETSTHREISVDTSARHNLSNVSSINSSSNYECDSSSNSIESSDIDQSSVMYYQNVHEKSNNLTTDGLICYGESSSVTISKQNVQDENLKPNENKSKGFEKSNNLTTDGLICYGESSRVTISKLQDENLKPNESQSKGLKKKKRSKKKNVSNLSIVPSLENVDSETIARTQNTQTQKESPEPKISVTNKTQKMAESVLKKSIPKSWTCQMQYPMPECQVIFLECGHPEFQKVEQLIQKTLRKRSIQFLYRVENPYQYGMFLLKKSELKARYDKCSEVQLFHGTKTENWRLIAENNFDWRLNGTNVGNKFGQGISLSHLASYANTYAKDAMFVVRTLVVEVSTVDSSTVLPLDGTDTTRRKDGKVWVKYDDATLYPEYVAFLSPDHGKK